jgi:4-hydroxythreonine-4-phosphate dehydrogenase
VTPPILVLPGDPRGIGPEVTAKALSELGLPAGEIAILGDPATARAHGIDALAPAPTGEPVEIASIRDAVARCRDGRARAMVTGPIHKARLHAQGFGYRGHTDFLGALCGVEEPVMVFVGGSAVVALVTVHVPIARVPALVTRARVGRVIAVVDAALRQRLGVPAPRIAVCGLNPHAGEGGVLGTEEISQIGPAIGDANALGIDARGPVSAEAAFAGHVEADAIVAMYHDQGLVPLKALHFGRTVNWTLGLPIVRTSVDHGTADDLVGTGRASASSMVAAISLARRLTGTSGYSG